MEAAYYATLESSMETTNGEMLSNIIARVLRGDSNAFEHIVSAYKEQVFKTVKRFVPYEAIDEVSQLAFIKIFRSLSTFRAEAPFAHWLTKISVRTCYDYWRSERKKKEISISEKQREILDGDISKLRFDEKETLLRTRELLWWALGKVSSEDTMVLILLYIEEHTEREAAELLGWSIAKIKIRAYRSRKHLREILTEELNRKDI